MRGEGGLPKRQTSVSRKKRTLGPLPSNGAARLAHDPFSEIDLKTYSNYGDFVADGIGNPPLAYWDAPPVPDVWTPTRTPPKLLNHPSHHGS